MTAQIRGIVRDEHTIQVETSLPYEKGSDLVLQIEAASGETEAQALDMLRRLRAVAGIGRSGLSGISENKHRYLADAYGIDSEQAEG